MTDRRLALTFVIPVKDGAAFLRDTLDRVWAWLVERGEPAELLVVDDGSSDATPTLLATFASEVAGHQQVELVALRNVVNRGKGYSLRRAFLHARGDRVLFTDADLTYGVDNAATVLATLDREQADIVIGSRMHDDSRYVVAPNFFGKLFTRHLSGRIFNLLVRAICVPGVRDTQAGLKGFRREAAQELATRVQLDRFSFDVELLFVARRLGLRVTACPVLFVYCKEPSTVHFVRDSLAMVRDMLRIRWRGWRGAYRQPLPPEQLAELHNGGAAATGAAIAPGPIETRRNASPQRADRVG
ncbi:MAG: glycosyltransferase [Planctomycetota bacterium]